MESSINDATNLGGREHHQRFCDDRTEILVLKSIITMGEGVSKIVQKCLTSLMDDTQTSLHPIYKAHKWIKVYI